MITTTVDNPEVLRSKIIHVLDILSIDELKRLHQLIAGMAAEKATKLANLDWDIKGLSRDKINEEIRNYRQSKNK